MKGFIFDLDGTVYLGDRLIDGAREAIQTLRDRGDKVVFLSNKPIATRESYAHKLTKMGIPTKVEDVLNSSLIVARYLQTVMKQGEQVLVIGEMPVREELRRHGIKMSENPLEVQYVVLSWDREFTYNRLNDLFQATIRGAKVIATNPDRTCPMEDGQIPDTGSFIGAIEGATGKSIDLVVGKPSPIAAELAVKHLDLDYEDCYMVGDRLETDIKMGIDTGMNSVLVLTGISTREMAENGEHRPTYICESIKDIVQL
ncbi:HAD-IIA family hydrolase [Brevibacillus daliensis]|uniref:HAD-IIA family hydrolase n=1 Tax=Brevibacillus daliensis TaxID=2892995 RepID=UPI001E56D4F4|nr:HAD-IIA family hydrolase [Brevibacillus daliensis]